MPLFEIHKASFKADLDEIASAVFDYYDIPVFVVNDIFPNFTVNIRTGEGKEHFTIMAQLNDPNWS